MRSHVAHATSRQATTVTGEPADSNAGDNLDVVSRTEPWLTKEAQLQRRALLQLSRPAETDFISQCEFISLGNFCGVARSLQCLGLKKYSYPFDWVRSPVSGIIHCLENEFSDFLTWTVCRDQGVAGKLFGSSSWGGSFWHHDPASAKTRDDFTRRIERLYGLNEVAPSKTRCFVWAINSTRELEDTLKLHRALKHALPEAKIYLLVLIDLQGTAGPMRIAGEDGDDLFFYRINEDLFAENGANWTMQRQGEAYAEAVAFAIRAWAGASELPSGVKEVANLNALTAQCEPWEGGSASNELFFPRRIEGQRITLRRRASQALLDETCPQAFACGEAPRHVIAAAAQRSQTPRGGDDHNEDLAERLQQLQEIAEQVKLNLPTPIESELGWRPPLSRPSSRPGSRVQSPRPSRTQVSTPPTRRVSGALPHGMITPSVAPAPVEHELLWTPGSACHTRGPSRNSSRAGSRPASPLPRGGSMSTPQPMLLSPRVNHGSPQEVIAAVGEPALPRPVWP